MKKLRIDFYKDAQTAIETQYLEYLPRFDGKQFWARPPKENRKDGYIERPIHGAMHVGDASLWILVLHQLFKENFPQYVKEALLALKTTFDLDEAEVVDATRMGTIYHDSARLAEQEDHWDKQSAEKFSTYLRSVGADTALRSFFEMAAANKDKSKIFEAHFKSLGMPYQSHYVRKLIKLADCIDIIRCVSDFQLQFFLNELKDIPEYHASIEQYNQIFLEFAVYVHRVKYLQGDLRYPCRIILPNGKIEKTEFSGDHLVMRRKVQFEHAPNVVSALAADIMRSTPYFVRFFKDEPLLCTDLATVEPMFDCFVHGTQSSMLIMLEKSGYVLESPVGLLRKQCTTLTGELYPGYSRNSLDSSPMMCFGKLHQWRGYNLKDVIKGYTARELVKTTLGQHQQNAAEKFHHYLAQARKDSYSSINPLLLYYTRARYLGVSDEQLMSAEDLCKEYKAAVDVYYLLLLIAEHLEVDKDHDRQYGPAYKLSVKRFDFGLLVQRILFLQLDIKAIYENPTSENLGKLLALFPVLNCPDNPEASFVKVIEKPRNCSTFEDGHDFENVTVYDGFSARINHFFCGFHKENCFTGYIGCNKHIPLMEAHLTMVRRLTQAKPENLFDNPFNKDLLLRNFPLVLVSENAEAMQIMNSKEGKEYRAKRALRFGVDITMVATDTRENALTLKQWLNKHHFTHVTVVLFHELEQVKDTCRQPRAYYQHFDGFPRLSWLAATQVKPEDKQQLIALRDQGQQELEALSNSRQGTMEEGEALIKKVEAVSSLYDQVQLVEDAERYKSSNSIQ